MVLIGPVDGHRHCSPGPHYLRDRPGWRPAAQHDIRGEGEDLAVVYHRTGA